MSIKFIDRPPRIQPELPKEERQLPDPPGKNTRKQSPWMHALLPIVTIFGYLIMAMFGQGRNLMMMVPMGLSVVAATAIAVIGFNRESVETKKIEEAYEERLLDLRREMVAAHDMQRIFYLYNYPDPSTTLKIGSGEEMSRSGSRLWERRPTDADFGTIRLGMGTRASTVTYVARGSADETEKPQFKDALRLSEDSMYVHDVPITIPLRPAPEKDDKIGASAEDKEKPKVHEHDEPRHAIGISGENRAKVSDVIRAIAVHFTAFHSPNDTRVFVVGAPEARRRWEWAVWLPHTNTRTERYLGDQMCFDESSMTGFWDSLRDELDKRHLRLQDKDDKNKGAADITLPMLLVIVDKLDAQEGTPLWTAESEAAASMIMQRGPELGAAIIFLVPEASRVPSDCQAVIEVEPIGSEVAFRYAETGLNTLRYIGQADTMDPIRAERQFAHLVKDLAVRRSFGDDIGTYIDLLELFNVGRIDEMPFAENWEHSKTPQYSDWVKVPLGLMSGNKLRELYMHQDYDGVHGMIAGTTGSGKSELLLTFIAGLAIKYDPTIVNLALVDYKGGAAFEPFREMPHVVDIVTNLEGNAVERMFIAIKAELDRRSALITKYNVKHLVEYRKKGYHLTHEPFPHLLIIVDEFAEMVAENSEYKARFDSITRLGRAIGVSLILATQRPTGAVTDQMRANMKFKMCLRVETTDDSRELLKRSDAAFLPSNLPGRSYIQVGNEAPELMQVARAGGPYSAEEEVVLDDVIWLDEEPSVVMAETPMGEAGTDSEWLETTTSMSQTTGGDNPTLTGVSPVHVSGNGGGRLSFSAQEIADAIHTRPETMVDFVVGTAALLAEQLGVPKQTKPWPSPLPSRLPLNLPIDATYLNTDEAESDTTVLVPELAPWLEGQGEWQPTNWRDKPLQVSIGIADNPHDAEQRLLNVDLLRGPVVLFGSPGWGKTTFLRTLMLSLAAKHSPSELNIYALDFAKGGLSVLQALPHLGATIDSTEDQRVERLLRMLGNVLDTRRPKIMQYGSLAAYNAENPQEVLPAVLVVVDNFGEFKENYEDKLPMLTALVRDGRAFGIYFAIAASQTSDVPSKLYNLFTERMSLKLPDPSEYSNVVGRGAPSFNDVAGRGVVNINRLPLEFQAGIPIPEGSQDGVGGDEGEVYEEIAQAMSAAYTGTLPEPVEILPEIVMLADLLPPAGTQPDTLAPIIGLNDLDRRPTQIDLEKLGPHFLVTGPPLSGKSTAMRTWAISLAYLFSPKDVAMVLVDPKKSFFSYGGTLSFAKLPHVLSTVSEPRDVEDLVERLKLEFSDELIPRLKSLADKKDFRPDEDPRPRIVVLIDNYDDFGSLAGKVMPELGELARSYGSLGLHFVIGGSLGALRSRDDLLKQVEGPRYSLVLQDAEAVRNLGGKVPYALMKAEYPSGRGFAVKSVKVALTQIAMPYSEQAESIEGELDAWVKMIQVQHWPHTAKWRYSGPLETIETARNKQKQAEGAGQVELPPMEDSVRAEFERQLREMGFDPADFGGKDKKE